MLFPSQIPYNPSVLCWARERIGLSKAVAAEKLGVSVSVLEGLEDGSVPADLDQLKKLAKAYGRTLATLLLREPPDERPMPRDFRSVNSTEIGRFDEKTIIAVRKARAYVASLLELKREAHIDTLPFQIKASDRDSPERIADTINASWNLTILREIAEPKRALEAYIEKLEERGIAVFQLSLTRDNVRGFALTDESMPVIAIKRGGENPFSKIFTLFHELGHILLRVSAITDASFSPNSHIEQWCNAFAAAIILPQSDLARHPIVRDYERRGELIWAKKDLIEIGESFHAGPLATLRALLKMGRTTPDFYNEKHLLWNRPQFGGRSNTPEGRNMPREALDEKGRAYVTLAFRLYDRNRIDLKDLSDYLGLGIKYLPKTRELLGA